LGTAVVFAGAEIITPSFFIGWFGIGAIAGALASFAGFGLGAQIGVFLVVSFALVLSTKRITSRWMRSDREAKTNVDALIGLVATVTVAIPSGGSGQVRIRGESWSAKTQGGEHIPSGTMVQVIRVDGVHLVVSLPEANP